MKQPDLSGAAWRKSVRSASNEACVEVAPVGAVMAVRDTKNRNGGTLLVGARSWSAFAAAVKSGRLDAG